jgi:hypothetical protein
VDETNDKGATPAPREGFLRRQYGGRGVLKMVLMGVVTAAVLGMLLWRVDVGRLLRTLSTAEPELLVAALAATVLQPLAGSLRWFLMLRVAGERVGYRTCVGIFYAALPANVLTPSKAGDLLRAVLLRDRISMWKGSGIILAERLVDVCVLASLALGGSLLSGQRTVALAALGVLAAGVAAGAVAALDPALPLPHRVTDKVEKLSAGLRALVARPAMLLAVAGASTLAWSVNLAVTTLFFRALGADVPFFEVAGTMPIALFVGLVPVTLSGMGTRDSAIVVLFAPAVAEHVSLGVGLLYSIFLYWVLALVGLPFLRMALRRPPAER